jgi:hypothetical protein
MRSNAFVSHHLHRHAMTRNLKIELSMSESMERAPINGFLPFIGHSAISSLLDKSKGVNTEDLNFERIQDAPSTPDDASCANSSPAIFEIIWLDICLAQPIFKWDDESRISSGMTNDLI